MEYNKEYAKKVYAGLSKRGYTEGDLGSEDLFVARMGKENNRRLLYDMIARRGDANVGSWERFNERMSVPDIDKSQYTFTERELGLGGYQLGQPIPIIEKMRRKETEAGAGTHMGDDIYRTKEGQYTRTEVPFRTIEYPSLGMAQMAARRQQREDALAAYRSAYNRLEAPGEVDERTLIEWGNNMDNAPIEQKNLYARIMGKDAANRVDLDAVMRSYDETKKSLEGVEDPEGLAAYLIMPAEQRVKLPEAERNKYEAALEEVEKAELAGNVNELHNRLSSLMEQQRRSDIKMREEYEENRGVGGFLLDALLQLPVAENPRMQGTIPSSQLDISPEGVHSNEQNAALTAAGRKWNEMKHIIDAAANGDIFDGLDKALSSADTWSSDQMLRDGMAIQRVVDKFDKNGREALTENEKALLDAIALNVAVSEVYGDEISNWYKGGEMIGEMVPYVIEMLMNPLSGVGRKAAEKITRAALKKYGKELVKKKAGRFALKRGAAKLGASVAGATGMALTTGLPAVGADIQRRTLGDATYGYDNDGNIEYTGHVGGEDLGTSAYKAVTSRMLDNVSEMLGAGYAKIPFKWLQKVGKGTKVLGWMDNLANSKTVKKAVDFMEKTKWNGPIEEFLEEVHVGLINPVLVGDHSWEEFFTADNLATIAIGVAVPGAAISALNTIGGAADGAFKVGAQERWKMQTAAARGAQLWKDNPGEWRALEIELSHDSMEGIEKELKKVYNNPELTPEQKKVALEYAVYSLQWRTAQGVKEAFNEGKKFIDPMLRDIYGTAYEQRIAPMEANKAYRTMTEAEKNVQEILGIGEKSVDEWLNGRTAEEAARSSKEKLAAIKAYQAAKLDFEGRRDRFIAERDIAYMESDRSIQAHDNNGMVYATQYEGQPVYITGGDVVLLESGKIDFDRSSESLSVKFPDGHVEMIAPENFSEVFTEDRTEDLKAAKRAEIDERWKAEFDTAEVLARQQEVELEKRESGVVFDMTDPEGSHRVEILNEGNGMADILLDGKEEQIPTEELNRWKQEAGIQSAENGVQSADAVVDNATDNGTPTESEANVAPTGDNVTPVAPVENNEPAPVELPDVPDFFRLGGKNYSVASRNNDGSVDVMVDGKRETLPAGTDYSTHMPTDKKGEVQYEQMPVERTHEYFVQKVKDDEARAEMIEKRRKKAEAERKKFDKKPDPGIDPDAYEAKMTQWEADKKDAQAKVDYWKEVAKRDAEITRSETREAVNNIKPDVVEETADEFIANQLAGIKITPESFKRETGLSNAEQAQLVGVISNDGVSVERAAEIITENYDSELKALGFTGDVQDVRNAIISILSQGNPRGYAKRGYEARVQDDVDQQRADAEAWAKGAFDMKLEELYLYEETILPRIMRDYEGFDENEYYSNLAENNGYDTTRESESIGRGGELLQGEQPVPAGGTPVAGQRNEGGAVSDDVQGGGQNGVAQEEVPVNEPVGNSTLEQIKAELKDLRKKIAVNGNKLRRMLHMSKYEQLTADLRDMNSLLTTVTAEQAKEEYGIDINKWDEVKYDALWAERAQLKQQIKAAEERLKNAESAADDVQSGVNHSLSQEEAQVFITEMEANAEVAPEIELTIENWDSLFGEDGLVETPIGEVKMGENQFTKLMRQGRDGKLGMVKPTLENPDVIIEDESKAKNGETERPSSYVFVKSFKKADGSRYYYFTSVTVSKDGKEVIVSNQEKRRNAIANLLTNGKLVWKHADNVSNASDVANGLYSSQGNSSDLAAEGTDAPQTNVGVNEVYNRHTTAKQPTETVEASQDAEQSGTQATSSMNAPTTSSASEDRNSVSNSQENAQKSGEIAENGGERMYSQEELAEIKEQLGELNATSAPDFAVRLFSIRPWGALEEANAALKELLASYGETLNGQTAAVLPFLDEAQRLISENSKNQEPRSVEEDLDNGDKRITNYNSRGEVATVAIERDGKVVSVDSYDEGVLFEHTEYDGNGKATSVTRYDKQGNVVGTQVYEDGKAKTPMQRLADQVLARAEDKQKAKKGAEKKTADGQTVLYRTSEDAEDIPRLDKHRVGSGPLTDREVVMESDVYSKVLGKPRYYGQKQRNYVARQRAKMAQKATELAEKLNTPIEVRETAEGLTGKKAKAKGWYDVKSGNIVVVVSNHGSIEDIQATVLHEVVAHKGLRQMFGEHFDAFLDNVYNNVDAEIRAEIDALTEKYGNTREATEEYLASLAENTYFENVNPSLWSRIKQWFLNMLTEVGIKLDFELSDNELRYILWRSHQRLVNPGIYNPVTRITDVAVRARLGIGEYAPAVEEMSHVAEEDAAEYANKNQDIFVSNAQRAVEGIQQNKATAEQWIAMLKKNGGLKAGEDAWLGLEEWLAEKQGAVTKQEILDYIAQNRIQIEEVQYGESVEGISKETVSESEEFGNLASSLIEYDEEGYPYVDRERFEQLKHEDEDFLDGFSIDYWGESIEVNDPEAAARYLGLTEGSRLINSTRLGYTTDGLENKREIALVVPTVESWNASDEIHFGDAGNGRAVAWVRFGETTDSEGNRVLVIDEIQSKRHQEGREKGYRGVGLAKEVLAAEEEVRKTNRELTAYREPLKEKYNFKGLGGSMSERLKNFDAMLSEEERITMDALGHARNEAEKRLQELREQERGIPSAPFEKNWHELAMKRMLRLAAEEGFDKVAWTTGEQQAQRYDMSKVVSHIACDKVGKNGNKSFSMGLGYKFIVDPNGIVVSSKDEYVGKSLADIVGKPLANKMLEMQEGDTISGDGLRIGGEGMKGFYDRMLPSFVQKYTRKWGAKVGEVTMPSLEENNTMWSVDVTPEMQESVMQGQTMFRIADDVITTVDDFNSTHKGAAPTVIIDSADTLEEQLRAEGFSKEDIAESLKDYDSEFAYYHPTYDKVVINDHDVSKDELIGYLWHENAHRAVRKLYTREEMERLCDYIYKDDMPRVREVLSEMGYKPEELAEEAYVRGIEDVFSKKDSRRRLERGGLKPKEDATEEEKVIIDSVNRIVDFINNGREEERADGRRAGGGYAERSTQENRRGQDEEVRNSQETGENTQAGETRFRTVEETTDGSIDDVPAQPLTLMERIANSLLEVSAKNKENLELRASALRTFGRDINRVLSLMKAQREYDKSTVDTLVKLAKMYFKNAQLLGEVDTYTMGRVLSLINNVVGKRDVTASAAKLMDILLDAHTKALAGILDKAEKVKAKKVNAAGVEVMGRLDKYGQKRVEEYRAAKEMTPEKLEEAIYDSDNRLAELEQRVREELGLPEGDVDQAAREYIGDNDAVNVYMDERARFEGLTLAREYKESIQQVQEEIKDLKKGLKQAEEDYRLGNIDGKSLMEFRKSVAEAIMESKAGLIEGYHSLIYKFQENTKESSKRAKAFAQAQIDRAREIQHNANSDMQGIPADTQGKYPERFNSSVARALMAPMATFQGMMKKVGEKNVEGKGYLYERFVPQATMASDNEFRGKVAARVMIESRLKEIFGKKMTIAKFMKSLRKDGVTIEYREGNEMKAFALTRGQMLYIYMVNKMADGQMKLRRMGITDDVVAGLMTKLPEEAVQFADWAQDVLLKGLRGKYNAVHERVFGAPMAAIENYFPIKIRKEARGEKGDVSEVGQEGKPSTVTGSIIKRTKNATAIDLSADAMQVLMEHIDDMEHWAAFAEFNRDLNVLLNYKHFQNQVKNMTSVRYGSGTELWKNFKRTAQIVSGTYRPSDSSFDRFVQNITKGVTRAKINFRVFTAIKQLLSAPAFWTDAGVKELAYCYVNPKGSFKWAKENLPGFAERWQGRTMGNEKLLKSYSDWEIWRNETVEKATRWGMTPNAFIDALTVAQGARAVYMTKLEQFKKAGYTEQRANEKALQAAAEAYNESQQSSEGVYLSPLQVEGTAMAAMVSTFKNSNFGYTRKTAQAAANIKRKMRKGYKEETIAFMTKQMMRDGLSEENAKRFAEKVYYKSIYRDAANVAMFGFGLNLLWEAGGMAIYLFLGDDDEEKEKMKEEIAMRAALSVLQGIPFGDTMISAVTAVKEGDSKYLRLPELIAVTDIKNLAQVFDYDTVRAANDVLNILVSMGVGVTPQVFTDVLVAIADIEDFSVEELGMFVARLVNAPQSNLDRLMVDDAMENSAINADEIMRRYAEYKKSKNAPITQFFYPEEEEKKVIERYEKRFEKLLDERLENVVEDNDAYDLFYKGADARRKSELAKMRQKYLAEDKAKALEKLDSKELVDMVLNSTKEANKDINEEYFNLTNAEDEDTAFIIKSVKKALDDLKDGGKLSDKERGLLSRLNELNYAINKAKRLMERQPERAQEHMNNIREMRAKAMELINNYRKDE